MSQSLEMCDPGSEVSLSRLFPVTLSAYGNVSALNRWECLNICYTSTAEWDAPTIITAAGKANPTMKQNHREVLV